MKLRTAIRRFERQMRADGKSPHTAQVYLRDLRFLGDWLERDVNISTITPDRLARYLTSKAFTHRPGGKPKATISINRSKSALRSFFRFLTDSRHLKNNPARLVKSSRVSQRPPRYLSDAEARQLLSTIRKAKGAIAKRDLVMFSLLLGTGIRLQSLVNLSVGDIDLGEATLRVVGKGNVERVVFLNAGLQRLLERSIRGRDGSEPLFLSSQGHRIGARQVQLRLAHWMKAARIKSRCSVHSLRHAFATRLYEQTGDLRLVQVALGHRRVSTTEIYTRVVDARVKQAVRNMAITGRRR